LLCHLSSTKKARSENLAFEGNNTYIRSQGIFIAQTTADVKRFVISFENNSKEGQELSSFDNTHKLIKPKEARQYAISIAPIDDLPVLDGDELVNSSTWDWQANETTKTAYRQFLPKMVYSRSHPAFDPMGEHGRSYLKKNIHGRYVKITDGNDNLRMIVLDNDDRNYYSWKGKLPHPSVVIINPLTLHSHVVYFLSEEVNLHDARYKALRIGMARRLGGDVDYKNAGQKFRSPFFVKGDKEWSYFKDDVLQPDCHYVLIHEDTWTKTYSLSELEDRIKPTSLDDLFPNEDVANVLMPASPSGAEGEPASPVNVLMPAKTSGYQFMWESGLKNALKCYSPDTHTEVVKRAMRAEFETYGCGVKEYKIIEAVRCAYNFAQKTYDASKRRGSSYDHSSETQREVANIRYNRQRDIIGALNIDKIKASGVSKATFYRQQRKGETSMFPIENQKLYANMRWADHGETLEDAGIKFGKTDRTIKRWVKEGKVTKIEGIYVLSASHRHEDISLPDRHEDISNENVPIIETLPYNTNNYIPPNNIGTVSRDRDILDGVIEIVEKKEKNMNIENEDDFVELTRQAETIKEDLETLPRPSPAEDFRTLSIKEMVDLWD